MRKTILYTQENWPVTMSDKIVVTPQEGQRNAISYAAVGIAEDVNATAIIAETKSGATAANIASCRPGLPIVAVTSEPRAAQQLA
jgi:pyruvate kinase